MCKGTGQWIKDLNAVSGRYIYKVGRRINGERLRDAVAELAQYQTVRRIQLQQGSATGRGPQSALNIQCHRENRKRKRGDRGTNGSTGCRNAEQLAAIRSAA